MPIAPRDFLARVDRIVGGGVSPAELADRYKQAIALRDELQELAGDLYRPRF